MAPEQSRIGFIGQGWIGKNYADDFEARGYSVIRYALEEPYVRNKEAIQHASIVFIAVPTPTTAQGFDDSYVDSALSIIAPGSTAVIKSTIQPGTTNKLADKYPQLFVMHSPEFLREKTAAYDAAHPTRNIIGIPHDTPEYQARAKAVLDILPPAPFSTVMDARSAELVKYIGNTFLMTKVVFFNVMYDLSQSLGLDWDQVRSAVVADSRIGESHTNVVDTSGHSDVAARGAGGHCFIKDFAALREQYETLNPNDSQGIAFLRNIERKNAELLRASGKDTDILDEVYGK